MKLCTIFFIFLLLTAVGVAGATAKTEGPDNGLGQQVQNQTQIQVQDRLQNMQNLIQNKTRAINVTILHPRHKALKQIQERKQAQEQAGLPTDQQRVTARYSNVSAFVHILLNESQNNALFGDGARGIGPQVSEYARQFNNSLQAQVQAEERIEKRNAVVRFFAGGDQAAAGTLEQETVRNQERIQEMQQLITQCQDCDAQIMELLQAQLKEMEGVQTRLQLLAEKEEQDRGIFGWFRK